MRTSKLNLASLFCLLFLQIMTNLAQASEKQGNSSGGGTGDNVFAVQELMNSSPLLTPLEKLQMMFEESVGRVPQLIENPNLETGDVQILMGGEYTNGYSIEFLYRGQTEKHSILTRSMGILRSSSERGPLIASTDYIRLIMIENEIRSNFFMKMSETGILARKEGYAEELQIEFRQYKEGILVYAITSPYCKGPAIVGDATENKRICEIGYDWKN